MVAALLLICSLLLIHAPIWRVTSLVRGTTFQLANHRSSRETDDKSFSTILEDAFANPFRATCGHSRYHGPHIIDPYTVFTSSRFLNLELANAHFPKPPLDRYGCSQINHPVSYVNKDITHNQGSKTGTVVMITEETR